MTLGLEYLIRSGAIRQFLQTPCSLFVESKDGLTKAAISLQQQPDSPDLIFCEYWSLGHNFLPYEFPRQKTFALSKEKFFKDERIILKGFQPLPYREAPLISFKNATNSPINAMEYHAANNDFLNSLIHRFYKKDWLWDCFVKVYLPELEGQVRLELPPTQRRLLVQAEQKTVRGRFAKHWTTWKLWTKSLLHAEKVAPELVFLPDYGFSSNQIIPEEPLLLAPGIFD